MEIKRRILENIGETKGYEYSDGEGNDLAPAWLEKKVTFCRQHLALQQVELNGCQVLCEHSRPWPRGSPSTEHTCPPTWPSLFTC